ncbi:MAG: flagellin, partial [Pseudomonadota bacterium]|nr:flagellin [Pseudomonadota bacterium]
DVWINNVDIGTITSVGDLEKDRAATIALINEKSGQTGVVATDNGKSITLTAADGRNISVFTASDEGTSATVSRSFGLDKAVDGIGSFSSADASIGFGSSATVSTGIAETTYSTVTLKSAGEINIEGGTKGTTGLSDSGFRKGEYGGGVSGQFLTDVDISTLDGANQALTAIDNALDKVNAARADLGAVQNRFETTISNLTIAQENLTAANSRIKDADFAAETAELSRTRVLQQAGISILAQANALPQQALSLLQ